MKKLSKTYHQLTRATAMILLLAFVNPTGLHAGELMEFCNMEMMSHDKMADSSQSDCHSTSDHDNKENNQHHDCGIGLLCACSIGLSVLGDEDWTIVASSNQIKISESDFLTPFKTTNERIQADHQHRINQYSPPLWLLYDTLLM